MPNILNDPDNGLTTLCLQLFTKLHSEFLSLDEKIKKYDYRIKKISSSHPICQKLTKIPGIGPIVATALLAAIRDPNIFKNGQVKYHFDRPDTYKHLIFVCFH